MRVRRRAARPPVPAEDRLRLAFQATAAYQDRQLSVAGPSIFYSIFSLDNDTGRIEGPI